MRAFVLSLLVTGACAAADAPIVAQQPPRVDGPAGISLVLPKGWKTGARDAAQMQLLPDDPAAGEAVVVASADARGATSLLDPAVIRSTEQEMQQLFPLLHRVGDAVPIRSGLGAGVRLDWEGSPPNGSLVRLSVHLALHQGQVVSVIAAGPQAQVLARGAVLEALYASFAPTPVAAASVGASPATGLDDGSAIAREWRNRLRGKKLTMLSGYSSGGGGGGMTSRSDLVLAADGRFSYESSSSVSMSVDGMGGSSSGRDSAEGRWRIVGRGGVAVLELVASEGRRELRLSRDGTRTFLNGERAFVTDP